MTTRKYFKSLIVAIAFFVTFFGMSANVSLNPDMVSTPSIVVADSVSVNEVENVANISFEKVAEAGRSGDFWRRVWHDIRRDTYNDARRDVERDAQRWREEQRNIRRADGDSRFAHVWLSDNQVRCLRLLKRVPVGQEFPLYVVGSDIVDIQKLCNFLPEYAFVGLIKDQYNETLGVCVYRHGWPPHMQQRKSNPLGCSFRYFFAYLLFK